MSAAPVRRALGVLLAALVGLGLVGCTGSDDSSAPASSAGTASPSDEGTPLADVATETLVVRRAPFCESLDPGAIARALGVDADRVPGVTAYENGQRTKLTADVTDVAHEYGCAWKRDGAVAKAWVFAPPVTRQRALTLFKLARDVAGCTGVAGSAKFGDPTLARSCRAADGLEVSYRGLFGDAWLTCSLVSPDAEQTGIADAAGRWCAAVATAASPHAR